MKTLWCGYLLEAQLGGGSNEYQQHNFVEEKEDCTYILVEKRSMLSRSLLVFAIQPSAFGRQGNPMDLFKF